MINEEKVYEIADKYLIEHIGNFICPGEPLFDKKVNVWIVPIFHRSKVVTFSVGEIIINSNGKIVYAPTLEQLEEIGKIKFPKKDEKKDIKIKI